MRRTAHFCGPNEAEDPYTEFLWGNNWNLDPLFVSGGKLFFHNEHLPINPLFRGAPAICLNATTGDEVWRVNGLFRKTDWEGQPIMGDSVIAMYNSYDQGVYAIGKGSGVITVEAKRGSRSRHTICDKWHGRGCVSGYIRGHYEAALSIWSSCCI